MVVTGRLKVPWDNTFVPPSVTFSIAEKVPVATLPPSTPPSSGVSVTVTVQLAGVVEKPPFPTSS